MKDLADLKCVPCGTPVTPLSEIEIRELLPLIPGWSLGNRVGMAVLERVFLFKKYTKAIEFVTQIGALAESEDHHPAMLIEYGKVTVTWWTHSIRALHRNDFILAARVDRLYAA